MNKIRLEIAALTENISVSRVVAATFVAHLDPTVEEVTEIKTAVSEAVTNAIIHGYGENQNEFVQIVFSVEERVVIIEVCDKGVGIENIESAREPLFTTKPELERSGMGFTVMESFMDSVEVSSASGEGTSVKLTKKIGGSNDDA
ncbi:MAG: anti-sigma F factor [Defluviitaleaceae bacterium]|nr:anti-sigma F factor [Defluviitaleaceae bacterium]